MEGGSLRGNRHPTFRNEREVDSKAGPRIHRNTGPPKYGMYVAGSYTKPGGEPGDVGAVARALKAGKHHTHKTLLKAWGLGCKHAYNKKH
jgi:hypothetical protein